MNSGEWGSIEAQIVSGNYFATLGVEAALGRAIVPVDDSATQRDTVVVLSYRFWQRAFAGSKEALELLITRHQRWIYNIALRMVFLPQDADDATQEILIKLLTKLSTFRGESEFRTWLYRLAVNHLLNMKRAHAEAKAMTPYEPCRARLRV